MPTSLTARRALTALGLAASLTACKDFTSVPPNYPNVTASDTVYALNGGPPNAPTALRFFDGIPSRADQGFGFDIAFDIDPSGNVRIIPAKALATTFSNPYSVALQRTTGTFESILEAPKDGYRADTTMVIGVGQTIVAESRDTFGVCIAGLRGQSFYTKLVVNDVDPVLRRIVFTITVNRNCGFRSFLPGYPED